MGRKAQRWKRRSVIEKQRADKAKQDMTLRLADILGGRRGMILVIALPNRTELRFPAAYVDHLDMPIGDRAVLKIKAETLSSV